VERQLTKKLSQSIWIFHINFFVGFIQKKWYLAKGILWRSRFVDCKKQFANSICWEYVV
jgi:hypothetical protein